MHVRVDFTLHGQRELIGAIRLEVRIQRVGIHAFRIGSQPGKEWLRKRWTKPPPEGAVKPSVPMRKALAGVATPLPAQLPFMSGLTQVTPCNRPGPSSGTRTRSTPFKRPKMRPYPPRITVLPLPKILPSMPSL